MAKRRLGEMLVDAKLLSPEDLEKALREQQRWGGPLGQVLVERSLISEDLLVKALSRQLNIPIAQIGGELIAKEVLALIPEELADQHSLIPFRQEGRFLDVAMSDPMNLGILDEIRIRCQLNVRPHIAGPSTIRRVLGENYGYSPQRGMASGRAPASVEFDFGGKSQSADPMADMRDAEIASLQKRLAKIESLIVREQDVIRKLLGLLVTKNVATREEILAAIR